MTEEVKCLLLLFLTYRVALLLRLDAARNRFVCDDDDGLLVIHDLDKRFADLHGQFLAVLVEEHHAVFEVLGCAAIARPAAADVFAVLEDFGHALTVQPDDRAGRVAARPGDIRAQDDHVRVGAGFAGVAVRIGVTVAVALEQPGGGVVFISGHISVGRRLVVDDDAVYILAALKPGLGEREGMRLGRFGIIRVHGAQVEPDVVRADVAAVAGAGEPVGVLADAVQIRIFQPIISRH